jgi:ethanolamine utilization cobalamin adenosyltransferase
MLYPTVHLNGSAKSALLDGYMHALEALRAAQDALVAIAPNPRDYYVQGDMAATQAAKEHAQRFKTLTSVLREIEAIAEKVSDQ